MAEQSNDKHDRPSNRRYGTGRTFEDLCNEVYRHGKCLMRDLERIESYIAAVSRMRDKA